MPPQVYQNAVSIAYIAIISTNQVTNSTVQNALEPLDLDIIQTSRGKGVLETRELSIFPGSVVMHASQECFVDKQNREINIICMYAYMSIKYIRLFAECTKIKTTFQNTF